MAESAAQANANVPQALSALLRQRDEPCLEGQLISTTVSPLPIQELNHEHLITRLRLVAKASKVPSDKVSLPDNPKLIIILQTQLK
jgi:hypothetical protein